MPYTKWNCEDCGVSGAIRHERGEPRLAHLIQGAHAGKAPVCHKAWMAKQADALAKRAAMPETVRLSARDRHILITARVRRKLLATELRRLREFNRAECRAQWVETKRARKGYAAT